MGLEETHIWDSQGCCEHECSEGNDNSDGGPHGEEVQALKSQPFGLLFAPEETFGREMGPNTRASYNEGHMNPMNLHAGRVGPVDSGSILLDWPKDPA